MPGLLDQAFDPRRFRREVGPELGIASGLRTAVARQPLLVSGEALTQGMGGPDLGRSTRLATQRGVGLASALGDVYGQEQGQRVQDEIQARQAFMAARAQEQARLEAGAGQAAEVLSGLGTRAVRGGIAAGTMRPGAGADPSDPDVPRQLRLDRARAFLAAMGG